MVRRVTPSQLRSMVQQAQQRQQRAVNEYNAAVRKHNATVRRNISDYNRAVTSYNREARAHNARVAAARRRLTSAVNGLSTTRVSVRATAYYSRVTHLHRSYEQIERSAPGTWLESREDILELAHSEAANSVTLAQAAQDDAQIPGIDAADPEVERRLIDFDPDLASRWRGAVFALDPRNPDAARHFSTSCREILAKIVDGVASDEEVLAANPAAPLHDGRPTRRARLAHRLVRAGRASDDLAAFADADVQEVVELFTVFNDGTHGAAGIFDIRHLGLIKRRVEGAVTFLHAILRP